FEAGKGTLKVVAQIAVGFDNINRADANKYEIPFTNTADVLTEATAEFAFFMMARLIARCGRASAWFAKRNGRRGIRFCRFSVMRSPARPSLSSVPDVSAWR